MPSDHPTRRRPGAGIVFLLPALIWSGYFVIVYSVQGATCAIDPGASRMPLALLTIAAVGAIGAVGVWGYLAWSRLQRPRDKGVQPRESFLAFATITNAGLFLVATIWVGSGLTFLDPCEGHGFPSEPHKRAPSEIHEPSS